MSCQRSGNKDRSTSASPHSLSKWNGAVISPAIAAMPSPGAAKTQRTLSYSRLVSTRQPPRSNTGAGNPREMDRPASQAPANVVRSEEHTSELQSLMRISYAVFCLKKTKTQKLKRTTHAYREP